MATLSTQRKLTFSLILLVSAWVILELSVLSVFRLAYGLPFPRANSQALIETLAKGPVDAAAVLDEPTTAVKMFQNAAVHPFLGIVPNLSGHKDVSKPLLGRELKDLTRKEGRLLVGLFGGSLAWWLHQDAGALLAEEIESATGREVSLVSFAWGGYKQPQQLQGLTYLLSMGAEFDVIINLDGFNELALPISENLKQGVFPNYPRSWNLMVGGIPAPDLIRRIARLNQLEEDRSGWARRFADLGLTQSNIALTVWRFRDVQLDDAINQLHLEIRETRDEMRPYQSTGPQVEYPDQAKVYEDLVAWWQQSSLQMHHLSRAKGAHYFHFLQPNQYVEGSKPMSDAERAIAYDPEHLYRAAVVAGYPMLSKAGGELGKRGVSFSDLTLIFQNQTDVLYKDTCCHVNKEGSRFLAIAIADQVAETISHTPFTGSSN